MGDPECQTIIPILETDLGEIVFACCEKKLHNIQIKWKEKKSVCIVLCSKGYPDDYKKNVKINQINDIGLNNCEYVFHAGTKIENGEYLATGGRVLNVIVTSEDFKKSKDTNLGLFLSLLNPIESIFILQSSSMSSKLVTPQILIKYCINSLSLNCFYILA